ncbi:HEAT repeat-containing protein [Chryseobacterium arachidis]|uniref:HEAT repeat-containing protein n=1 Tax=Chryseobacterium arachidis TaxID=1416778 RepID=A0A1M5H9T6_9FLAO|nr:HEAT repeat domain-containing protein [Chryseobacterium arachidis]SHG12725.1 HEAT repeat-containing protein [Chryseobacterium arachidis]
MKDPLKKYIQDHREEFDTLEVPDETFDKIMLRLNGQTVSEKKIRPLFSKKKMFLAASVAIILSVGFYTLKSLNESEQAIIADTDKIKIKDKDLVDILNQKDIPETAKIITTKQEDSGKFFVSNRSVSSKKIQKKENFVQNNHSENKNGFNKLKALELLNDQFSASSRLQGIALLKDFLVSDHQLIQILCDKALIDENTNVRLAAVEALSTHIQNPEINRNIKQIFLQQDDAMVQKELIEILSNQNSSELTADVNSRLEELTLNPTTADFVKDEAYAVLMRY